MCFPASTSWWPLSSFGGTWLHLDGAGKRQKTHIHIHTHLDNTHACVCFSFPVVVHACAWEPPRPSCPSPTYNPTHTPHTHTPTTPPLSSSRWTFAPFPPHTREALGATCPHLLPARAARLPFRIDPGSSEGPSHSAGRFIAALSPFFQG